MMNGDNNNTSNDDIPNSNNNNNNSNGGDNKKAPPSSASSSLSQFESDIAAKNRARGGDNGVASKPGVVGVVVPTGTTPPAASTTSATTPLSQLDRDIEAKNRARQPASSSSRPGVSHYSSNNNGSDELNALDRQIAAKCANQNNNNTNAVGAAGAVGNNNVGGSSNNGGAGNVVVMSDDDIKNQLRQQRNAFSATTTSTTGSVASGSSSNNSTNLTALDQRIAAKTAEYNKKPPPPSAASVVDNNSNNNNDGENPIERRFNDLLSQKLAANNNGPSTTAAGTTSSRKDQQQLPPEKQQGYNASSTTTTNRQSFQQYAQQIEEKVRANHNTTLVDVDGEMDAEYGIEVQQYNNTATNNNNNEKDYQERKLKNCDSLYDDEMNGTTTNNKKVAGTTERANSFKIDNKDDAKDGIDTDRGGMAGGVAGGDDLLYHQYDTDNMDDNLAVAIPITEEDDEIDKYLPAAIEFDPDMKNAEDMKRSRKFKLYLCMGIIIPIIIICVVSGIVVAKKNKAVTDPRAQLGIQDMISNLLTIEKDNIALQEDRTSPYFKAMHWILYQDPLQVVPYYDQAAAAAAAADGSSSNGGGNLLQRYILAYIYFATSMKRDWEWCAPLSLVNITGSNVTSSIDPPDVNLDLNGNEIRCRLMLQRFETLDTAVKESGALKHWLSIDNECSWAGVICDKQGNVRVLDLSGFNMTGTFPEGIAYLPFLTELHISFGELEGTLPKTDRFKHIEWFVARQNKFTGDMNATKGMRNLRILYLQGNQITGELPVDPAFWDDLKRLDVRDNQMVGQLPSATVWEAAKSMVGLAVGNNNFEGNVIPEFFTANANLLQYIIADQNKFSGTIPTEIGSCIQLYGAFFGGNNFTGPIPEEIYSIPTIIFLHLEQNQLTGTISPNIGNAVTLRTVRLEGNELSGTMPTNLGNYDRITLFNVDNNNLLGEIPMELCRYGLEELGADCLPDATGVTQITCPAGCCTKCCDPEGTTCQQMSVDGF